MIQSVIGTDILTKQMGSDHCPVTVTLQLPIPENEGSPQQNPIVEPPTMAAKYHDKFKKQNTIAMFFGKANNDNTSSTLVKVIELDESGDESKTAQSNAAPATLSLNPKKRQLSQTNDQTTTKTKKSMTRSSHSSHPTCSVMSFFT